MKEMKLKTNNKKQEETVVGIYEMNFNKVRGT